MMEQEMEYLLERLARKLGLDEVDEEMELLLVDELTDAENELKLYLDCKELGQELMGKVVELATVFYQRDKCETGGRSASSYSEGQISQSESYFSPKEYRAAVAEIFDSVARYRRVSCG